jgi:hypothetical protein|tara:strand:- start:750 stop:908 length:159 start_codon:yes stop_codon:yes gene_type:complete
MKVTWIGPTGQNPELGAVHTGKVLDLTGDRLKRYQDLKLVKTVETVSSKKKG